MAEEMQALRLQRKLTGIRMRLLRIGERRLEAMAEEVRQQMQALRSLRQPGIRIRRIGERRLEAICEDVRQEMHGLRQEVRQARVVRDEIQDVQVVPDEIQGFHQEIQQICQVVHDEIQGFHQEFQQIRQVVRDEIQGFHQEIQQIRQVVRDEIQGFRQEIQQIRQVVRDEIQGFRQEIQQIRQDFEEAGQEIREDEQEVEHVPKNLQETMEDLNGELDRLEEILNGGGDIPEGPLEEWIVKLMVWEQIQENRNGIQVQVDDEYGNLQGTLQHRRKYLSLEATIRVLQQKLDAAEARGGAGVCMLPVMYLVYACISLLVAGTLIYFTISDFGPTEQPGTFVDGLYVASSIILSIGFGDIPPLRPLTMFLCDGLALFAPVVVFILTYFLSRYAHDLERRVLPRVEGSSRTFYRVCVALIMILLTTLLGMVGIYLSEWMVLADGSSYLSPPLSPSSYPSPSPPGMLPVDVSSWVLFVDIFHLSVMMMTTTGFGDFAFTTTSGRVFAILWMPLSTTLFVVASAFLAETFFSYLSRRFTRDDSLLQMTHRDR